jgi:hypothetical protein
MASDHTQRVKKRIRLLQLLEAAERAALTPIEIRKFHSFAYLADILSPIWHLEPFEARLAKTGRSPYFPDLQHEIDTLVAMGLVEVSNLKYLRNPRDEVLFTVRFALRFESKHLDAIFEELTEEPDNENEREYLAQLANALGTLGDDDIEAAATEDATYSDPQISTQDYIELNEAVDPTSRTQTAIAAFDTLFPDTQLPPPRRLFMYAHYLGRKVHARA